MIKTNTDTGKKNEFVCVGGIKKIVTARFYKDVFLKNRI